MAPSTPSATAGAASPRGAALRRWRRRVRNVLLPSCFGDPEYFATGVHRVEP